MVERGGCCEPAFTLTSDNWLDKLATELFACGSEMLLHTIPRWVEAKREKLAEAKFPAPWWLEDFEDFLSGPVQ